MVFEVQFERGRRTVYRQVVKKRRNLSFELKFPEKDKKNALNLSIEGIFLVREAGLEPARPE